MKHQIVPAVVEALLEGRAKVEAGWCQGNYAVEHPAYVSGDMFCAMGALAPGYGGLRYLADALPGTCWSVSLYNDLPTTTKSDILALYDRAIEIALAQ